VKVVERSVYIGPNLYANFRVIRLVVDLGELEQWPTVRLGAAFTAALVEALPGLQEHGCSFREPGGFLRRMNEDDGTWMGHVLEHVAIELQNVAGADVTFGRTRSVKDRPGVYTVVYEYEQEEVGLAAGRLAMTLLHSLLPAELRAAKSVANDFDFATERDSFIRKAQRLALGPSTQSLVNAAEERGIPWIRLNRYSLVQFGHGRYQKRIQATITGETRHIAVELASDKEETNTLLADMGLPVARQSLVYGEEDAIKAAERIGYPLVVKPLNANHGKGVSIGLMDAEAVRVAFQHAQNHSRAVLIERFIEGFDHRILVIDGNVVAAAKRVPGHVVGDGEHTVAELVEIVNEDPRRGIGHEKILTKLEFDYQAERLLEQMDYSRDTVPPKGETVYLRSTGNLSTGGTATDVTDIMHPDNAAMAARAAKAIGLDVAGVDFLTTDITRSYTETGGAICEINAAPGLRMHLAPSDGKPRDVAGPIIDMLFPQDAPKRIPIAAITGTNGKTTTARMLAHIFKMARHTVGLTTTDGVYIDGQLTVPGDMTGPASARIVLRDPTVDVAVLETARGGLLRRGMAYRRSDVAACLNVQADHLGLKGIDTVEQLADVKRIVIETARDTAVLNADDPHCLKMAAYSQAENLCYVTINPQHPLVKEHIRAGGRACVLEHSMAGQMITFYERGAHIPMIFAHEIPATLDGKAMHNVQNAMFAAAVAYSMKVSLEDIRQGLLTFYSSFFQVPGRMNIYDELPFKVILDYGHNPAAVKAMVEMTQRMECRGQRICVIGAPGDRRDEDIRDIARQCAGHFDHYICRRDDGRRGRDSSEVPDMLAASLRDAGVADAQIEIVPEEDAAIAAALTRAATDDLLLIFGDKISQVWNAITSHEHCADPADGSGNKIATAKAEVPAPSVPKVELAGHELVHDERGVHIARCHDEDGD
jgi:cyanophycin synthetase